MGASLAPYHTFEIPDFFRRKEEVDEIRRSILSGLYRVPADETLPVPD